ncbi:MAG: TrkH family potassium uptake protein [Candidatus Neomarinimicrobiota bacterium]|nr:MAG: TrkH family potassium uptake protein [Candidatus Neomarinimicrobiota bacterium]
MLIPAFIALGYGEPDSTGFFSSAGIVMTVGGILWLLTRGDNRITNRDGFAIVSLAWILTAFVSSIPFQLTGTIPNLTDAFFESMSGVTTTGATILGNVATLPHLPHGIESLPHGVLFWRSFIQWIGGMGIVLFYIAILPLLGINGYQLFKAEVPGPVADKIRPRVRETAKYLWMVYVGITIVEILLLGISGMNWFEAICHSFTTMPTGGFSTRNASIGAFDNPTIHYIIILFMFLAGVNFSLHFKLLTGDRKAFWRDSEFRHYLGLVLGITVIIAGTRLVQTGNFTHEEFRNSLFQTVSILTTTGYATADYEHWTFGAQFILLSLMFIGACGGSTGGGMKVIRIQLILKYTAMETRRMLHSRAIIPIRIGNRFIDEDIIRNTLGFFLFYIFIFAVTTLLLTAMNVDITSAVGAAASALGNVGPALASFGPMDNYALLPDFAKWLLSFCMLLGRLEIFTVMVMFSRVFWK